MIFKLPSSGLRRCLLSSLVCWALSTCLYAASLSDQKPVQASEPMAISEVPGVQPVPDTRDTSGSSDQRSPQQLESDLEFNKAILAYKSQIEAIEKKYGEYANELIEPLVGLGRSYVATRDDESAEGVLHRAQHLSHRRDGVYSPRQLEIIDLLTQIYLDERKALLADQQQQFSFFISEHIYGPESAQLLPALDKLGAWYTDTGQLSEARKINARGRELTQKLYGENSVEQLPYLVQISKLKRLQRVCCSSKVMDEALKLVEANGATGEVAAQTYLNAADAYTVSGDEERAHNYYQLAWQSMNAQDRQDAFSSPHKIVASEPLDKARNDRIRMFGVNDDPFSNSPFKEMSMRERLAIQSLPPQEFTLSESTNDYNIRIRDRTQHDDFIDEDVIATVGKPFTFSYQQLMQIMPARFRTTDNLNRLQMEIVFTVTTDGDAREVEINSDDAPGQLVRLMRQVIIKTRFRPRLENGMPVETKNYRLIQTFKI